MSRRKKRAFRSTDRGKLQALQYLSTQWCDDRGRAFGTRITPTMASAIATLDRSELPWSASSAPLHFAVIRANSRAASG